MTDTRYTYRFVIDAYTPDTLPMWRLADYMADLARLLGEVEHVHFARVEPGSTVLVQHIEHQAALKVQRRLRAVARDDALEGAPELSASQEAQSGAGVPEMPAPALPVTN